MTNLQTDKGGNSRDVPREETGALIASDKVEGTAVYGPDGRDKIGKIETVMLDKLSGRVAYAVLSFGGFLGIGSDRYPVPWSKLTYDERLAGYRIDVTAEQLKNAPKYNDSDSCEWTLVAVYYEE
jgi:hypothetical protein